MILDQVFYVPQKAKFTTISTTIPASSSYIVTYDGLLSVFAPAGVVITDGTYNGLYYSAAGYFPMYVCRANITNVHNNNTTATGANIYILYYQ